MTQRWNTSAVGSPGRGLSPALEAVTTKTKKKQISGTTFIILSVCLEKAYVCQSRTKHGNRKIDAFLISLFVFLVIFLQML